ncbi:heparan-alpha-glucosaminide N-acetyltransferase domain-containing protein [Massilia sp. B-10]|nr:heparan-alpha-glucosaminide N-acetyltransferase domain-containing protein [Massilia sp. B-10]
MIKPARVPAIDMLRGFVIALMALDHTRDYFGYTRFNPEDLATTEPAWFWTRWITHLCATTFVLLA